MFVTTTSIWNKVIYILLVQHIREVSANCRDDSEYTIQHPNRSEECFPCPDCPRGFGLQPPCGSYLSAVVSLQCKPCILGDTYSPYLDINPCLPCGICAKHAKVVKNCTIYLNSKCSHHCDKGFYYNTVTADCQPCSWCCHDDNYDDVIDECKAGGMPPYKRCGVEQALKCQPKCRHDQYILVNSISGAVTCRDCPTCPLGTGLVKECGHIIDDPSLIKCERCETGKTYSDEHSTTLCKKCSTCSAKVVKKACATKADTKCGDCFSGYYQDNSTNRCSQCSYCCGDDSDVRVQECVLQGMPTAQQCLLTQRSATVCHIHPASRNLSIRTIAMASASVIAAVLIFTVIYVMHRRKKGRSKGYTMVSGSSMRDEEQGHTVTASVALQSTDVEWAVAHGSTETISFRKSGIKVEFTDSESYADLSQNLAVEICWDEKNYPQLKEGEILLSPVVRFHPHKQALTNVCRVKIPHTALLEGTRDPQLMLKRGVFERDNCSWEDVSDSLFSVEATEVCFSTENLQSYAVVGSGDTFQKRMQCAMFAGKEITDNCFTADLCFIDDCEASQERIFQEERAKGRNLLGSWHAVYIAVVDKKNVNIEVQTISEGWSVLEINPKAFSCSSYLESYKNIPRSEITFHQGDTTKRDFQCSIFVENEQKKIVVPVFSYFEKKPKRKKQTRSILQGLDPLNTTENVVEDMSSDRISTIRLSDLSPTTLGIIRQQLLKKQDSDARQETVQPGVEETMDRSTGIKYLHVGERTKENRVDYLTGMNLNITVEEFTKKLQKMGRVDVVQILMSYPHGANAV